MPQNPRASCPRNMSNRRRTWKRQTRSWARSWRLPRRSKKRMPLNKRRMTKPRPKQSWKAARKSQKSSATWLLTLMSQALTERPASWREADVQAQTWKQRRRRVQQGSWSEQTILSVDLQKLFLKSSRKPVILCKKFHLTSRCHNKNLFTSKHIPSCSR